MLGGARRPRGRASRPGTFVPDRRGRGRAHRARARAARAARRRSAASCGPAAAATTRSRPTCGCTCATTPGASPRRGRRPADGTARPGRASTSTRRRPGFTHLQHAQPVSFGHELASTSTRSPATSTGCATGTRRAAVSPLGAGALAGSSLPLDPQAVAARARLRPAPVANSIDAVSDRDFVAEFLFVAALIGVHLSRLGEEIVPVDHRGSSAGPSSTTPSPPARRSCRRRRTPTSPSWRAASPGG